MYLEFVGVPIPARHSSMHAYTGALFAHLAKGSNIISSMKSGVTAISLAIGGGEDIVSDPSSAARARLSDDIWGAPPERISADSAVSESLARPSSFSNIHNEGIYIRNCLPGRHRGWLQSQVSPPMHNFVA